MWVVCRPVWVSEACQLFLVPSRPGAPTRPFTFELGSVLRLLLRPLFSTWGSHLNPLRSWECVNLHTCFLHFAKIIMQLITNAIVLSQFLCWLVDWLICVCACMHYIRVWHLETICWCLLMVLEEFNFNCLWGLLVLILENFVINYWCNLLALLEDVTINF